MKSFGIDARFVIDTDDKSVSTKLSDVQSSVNAIDDSLAGVTTNLAGKAPLRNIVYSKIKADGTDDSPTLQKELSSLTYGDYFITPKGTSLLDTLVNPSTIDGVTLDFSATKFVEGATTTAILFKLKNSKVYGLYVDGNRNNKTFDQSLFGLDFLIKVDNNCENVIFEKTTLVNAPFCASMLGDTLKNITFKNLKCENIGEHIFYKTGYLADGKNIINFLCEDVSLHNICINSGYQAAQHFTMVFKCANDNNAGTGYCQNISFKNMSLKQDTTDYYGVVIYGGVIDLRDSFCENITGDFKSIYSGNKINNVKCFNSTVEKGFYTNASTDSYDRITFEKCTFTGFSPHTNLATIYKDCIFQLYFSTSTTTALQNKTLTFDHCRFTANTSLSLSHVYTDVYFKNCSFNSTLTAANNSGLLVVGDQLVSTGVRVVIENCFNNSNLFTYLYRFYSTALYAVVRNLKADGRIRMSAQIKRLELMNVYLEFTNGVYTNTTSDINALSSVRFNVVDATGTKYDNYSAV